jgi:hypothetical protein
LNYEYIDEGCYFGTFKIYQGTNFEELKTAACTYWGIAEKHHDEWVLVDEYFNILAGYKDTIQNFFKPGNEFQPLSKNSVASCFLMKKNNRRVNLHTL